MHKLAMGADHLLGGERDLFDRPAILVDGLDRHRFQVEWGSQQPGCGVSGMRNGIHLKGLGLRSRDDTWQNQVIPDLSAELLAIFTPGFHPIRRAGGDGFALVAALQGADLLTIDRCGPLPP